MATYLDKLKEKHERSITHHLYETPQWFRRVKSAWADHTAKHLPPVGEAQQLIVLGMVGDRLLNTSFVADPKTASLTLHKDADQLCVIPVNTGTLLSEPIEIKDCPLNDGQTVTVVLQVRYRVDDTKKLWQGLGDPGAVLETESEKKVQHFLFSITSDYLLMSPTELTQERLYPVRNLRLKKIQDELEGEVKQVQVAGLTIVDVTAVLSMSDELKGHLKKRYNALYEGNDFLKQMAETNVKFAGRQRINAMLDTYTTFAPYSLRDVIMALDIRLLEHFYDKEWAVAMQEVYNSFMAKKADFLQRADEVEQLRRWAKAAESIGMKNDIQQKLLALIAKRLNELDRGVSEQRQLTVQDFLHSLLGPAPSTTK